MKFALEEYGEKASTIIESCKIHERVNDFTTFTCLMGSEPQVKLEEDIGSFGRERLNYFTLGLENPTKEDLITLKNLTTKSCQAINEG